MAALSPVSGEGNWGEWTLRAWVGAASRDGTRGRGWGDSRHGERWGQEAVLEAERHESAGQVRGAAGRPGFSRAGPAVAAPERRARSGAAVPGPLGCSQPVPWARPGSSAPLRRLRASRAARPFGAGRRPCRHCPALSCPGSCKAFRSLRRSSVVSSVPDVCQGERFCFCDRRSLVVSYVLVTACVEKQAVSKRGSCVSWICLSKHPEKGSMWETKEL